MKLWVMSDLHQEFVRDRHYGAQPLTRLDPTIAAPAGFDAVVVAGDVDVTLLRSIRWLADRFAGVPVVYVPGNHDFYADASAPEGVRTIDELVEMGQELAVGLGIHLLVDKTIELGGVRFAGGTLWTNFVLGSGSLTHLVGEARGRNGMNDYKRIRRWSTTRSNKRKRLQPEHTIALHQRTRAFLEGVLSEPFGGRTAFITHHAPHPKSLDNAHGGTLDWCYASDLSSLMTGPRAPDLWIHGHIHKAADYVIGKTRIVNNPRGYAFLDVERENSGFRPDLVIDVGEQTPKPTSS